MDRAEIRQRLLDILTSPKFHALAVDVSKVSGETSLLNEIIIDSLQLLDFIVEMEKAFGFKATAKHLNLDIFDRFDHVVDFVQRSLVVAPPETAKADAPATTEAATAGTVAYDQQTA
jgi:acyl carrier protein